MRIDLEKSRLIKISRAKLSPALHRGYGSNVSTAAMHTPCPLWVISERDAISL